MFLSCKEALQLKKEALQNFDLNSFVEELLKQISKTQEDACTVKVQEVPAIYSDRLSYILHKAFEKKNLEIVSYSKGIEYEKEDYLVHIIKCIPVFERQKRRGRTSKVSDLADKILKFHLTQLGKEIQTGENYYRDSYKIDLHYDVNKLKSSIHRRLKKLGYTKFYLHIFKDSGVYSQNGAESFYQDFGGKIGNILTIQLAI